MMRLIDVNHAIKLLREIRNSYPADSVRHKMLNMVISILANPQQIPAVDAVPVAQYENLYQKYYDECMSKVQCKDCKHWCYEYDDVGLCTTDVPDIDGVQRRADDFCSYGERKDNG